MPPATCHLLEHLRTLLRKRLYAGETLPEISEDIDTPLSTLRKWLYKATTGDALALEQTINRLQGVNWRPIFAGYWLTPS